MTAGRFFAVLLLCLAAGPARAAAVDAQALVEDALAELVPPRVEEGGWTALDGDALLGAMCAPHDGPVLRVALTTRPPSRWQHESCVAATAASLSDRIVGHAVLLAFGGNAAPPLTDLLLYRALAASVPAATGGMGPNQAMRWHELDPALPDVPIRLLVPPAGTAEAHILTDLVLYAGCLAADGTDFSRPATHMARCTELRADAAVTRADRGSEAAAWLRRAGPSAVALVGLGAVAAEPELEMALPLNGVAPGFASIAEGTYRAALPVHLLVLQAAAAEAAAEAASVLTAESAIGPGGVLARRGLAALRAAERVRLRAE